jgi:maltooligosyltrehalose synthase
MRFLRSIPRLLLCLLLTRQLVAQKNKPEPLTEVEIEKIREAGIDPNERVRLYAEFLSEHADTIKSLTNRKTSPARSKHLDDELQNLTALMDELGSNLDTYTDRHADIRKALKPLTEASDHWLVTLRALAGEPGFDLARKEAIESCEDLADQAKRLLAEQTDYFNLHKDEQGQDREEPK